MIKVSEVYTDVAEDNILTAQNGDLSYAKFSRISKRAELRLLDWLTGDVSNATPPFPFTSQKVKDWASPFITPATLNVEDGFIDLPDDYYLFESSVMVNSTKQLNCETGVEIKDQKPNIPIELLDPQVFDDRISTYIKRLKPSLSRPISKRVDLRFEYDPVDLGTIRLLYYRYPKFANIVVKEDSVYKNEIIDENASTNYEWGEYAREILIWFITDTFAVNTREISLKQANKDTGKTVRP